VLFQGTNIVPSLTFNKSVKFVSLAEKLRAMKLQANISKWVLRTIENGHRIQFRYRPLRFNGVLITVKPVSCASEQRGNGASFPTRKVVRVGIWVLNDIDD